MNDKIGIYRGKPISQMSREELLDLAEWAGKEIWAYEQLKEETLEYRIDKEIINQSNLS